MNLLQIIFLALLGLSAGMVVAGGVFLSLWNLV